MPNLLHDPKAMSRRDILRTFALGGAGLVMPDLSWLQASPKTGAVSAPVQAVMQPKLSKLLPARAFTVLITYRDHGFLTLLRHLMEFNNFNAIITPSAQNLLDIARRQHVSLIISDVFRHDINGFDLVKTIRADPLIAQLPVMLWCTSLSTADNLKRAFEAGADDVLALPAIPITEHIARIARLLPVDPQSLHPRFRPITNEV